MDGGDWARKIVAERKPCHMTSVEEGYALNVGYVSPWHSREADVESERGPKNPVKRERIAWEDMTLIGGTLSEGIIQAKARGWIWPEDWPILHAFRARKHAPELMESDPLRE